MKCTKQNGTYYIQGFGKTLCLNDKDRINLSEFVKQFKGVHIDDNISKATNVSLLEAVQMMKNNKEISEWLYKAIGAKATYGKSKEIVEVPVYDEEETEELRSEINRLKEKINSLTNEDEEKREEFIAMLQERMMILQCSNESIKIMNDMCEEVLNILSNDDAIANESGIEYLLDRLPKLADETALVVEHNTILTELKRLNDITDISKSDIKKKEQLLAQLSEINAKVDLEKELTELREIYEETCVKLNECENEHKKLLIQVETVGVDNDELRAKILTLEKKITKLKTDKRELSEKIDNERETHETIINNMKGEIREKINELSIKEEEILKERDNLRSLQDSNRIFKEELDKIRKNPRYINDKRIADLEKEINRLNTVIKEGEQLMQNMLKNDDKILNGSPEEQLEKIQRMINSVLEYKQNLDAERERMENEFEMRLTHMNKEHEESEKALRMKLEEEILSFRREAASHRDMVKFHNDMAEMMKRTIEDVNSSKDDVSVKSTNIESLLEYIENIISAQIESYQQENAILQSKVEEMVKENKEIIERDEDVMNRIKEELDYIRNSYVMYVTADVNNVGIDQKIKVLYNARNHIDDIEQFINRLKDIQKKVDTEIQATEKTDVDKDKVEGGYNRVYGGERPSAKVINDIFVRMEIFVFGIVIVVVLLIAMVIWNHNKECERKKRNEEWQTWKEDNNDFPIWNPL